MITLMQKRGLDGVEMFYNIYIGNEGNKDHTDYLTNTPGPHYEKDMLWSGGSDFHTTAGTKNTFGKAWKYRIQANRLTVLDRLLENQKVRTECLINNQEMPYGDTFYAEKLYKKYEEEYADTCKIAEKFIYFSELDSRKEVLTNTEVISIDDQIISDATVEKENA